MNKNLFYSLAVIVIILIGIFIYNSFQSVSGSFGENSLGFDAKKTNSFSITSKGTEIAFERKDSIWKIVEPIQDLADQQKVKSLLESFSETKLVAPLSSNPEKQSLFGVDSTADKFSVDGKSFLVGKVGPDFQTTYLRMEGDNQVNIFTGLLSASLNASVNDFRNKEIYKADSKKVKTVEIRNQTENSIFVQDSAHWTLEGLKIDDEKMNPLITSLFDLTGDEIVDTLNVSKLSLLAKSFSLTISSDKKETINFYKIPEKLNYVANKEGSDRIYYIQDYKVDRFYKPKSYWQSTETKK